MTRPLTALLGTLALVAVQVLMFLHGCSDPLPAERPKALTGKERREVYAKRPGIAWDYEVDSRYVCWVNPQSRWRICYGRE